MLFTPVRWRGKLMEKQHEFKTFLQAVLSLLCSCHFWSLIATVFIYINCIKNTGWTNNVKFHKKINKEKKIIKRKKIIWFCNNMRVSKWHNQD